MSRSPLNIAILFHQHQPFYKDPWSGFSHMPWVRLHAIKDYLDMAAMVELFDGLKINFNIVPSLMVQLEDYAHGAMDRHLQLTLRPAGELSREERVEVLADFFKCNHDTMIAPYPRYLQLLEKRGRHPDRASLERRAALFSVQELQDLLVWSNLSWFDPWWHQRDPVVRSLLDRGQGYTHADAVALVEVQRRICGEVIPTMRRLQDAGRIEVAVSPFYHPILPLLCDSDRAKESSHRAAFPRRYVHPEDAERQIRDAVVCYTERFGRPPRGMWPSEGAVSDDVLPLMAAAGITWFATDEEILWLSLKRAGAMGSEVLRAGRRALYRPYRFACPGGSITGIFRDRDLSDAVGFIYTRWNDEDAVRDITARLTAIYEQCSGDADPLVSIILDGENCWEYYRNDGWGFLSGLYRALTGDQRFRTVLVSEHLSRRDPPLMLQSIWPGSWIHANYDVWIGHPEDNLAWEHVARAREALCSAAASTSPPSPDALAEGWEELRIAQGSDWYWWYGDDHYTDDIMLFDDLFRRHLSNVYRAIGVPPPESLGTPIKGVARRSSHRPPSGCISPTIDGRVTSYYEWQSAGLLEAGPAAAMHRTASVLRAVRFGYDRERFYLRADIDVEAESRIAAGGDFHLTIAPPDDGSSAGVSLDIPLAGGECRVSAGTSAPAVVAVRDRILEVAVPFAVLGIRPGVSFRFAVSLRVSGEDASRELERLPAQGYAEAIHPDDNYTAGFWSA